MQLFYTPNINGNLYSLDETESNHCTRVLRLKNGDIIYLTDGKGGFYHARIIDDSSKCCKIEIVNKYEKYEKRNYHLHIAIAPTKNTDRFEWFLEKATEIGIDEITPVLCSRSERKVIKPDRLEKILISAMKQSIKAYLPQLNPMCTYNETIEKSVKNDALKFIAHCEESSKELLASSYFPKKNALILIGPEGDFTPEEIQFSLAHQFKPVSLGNSRLRTETAGIVACDTISLINQLSK